MTDLQLLPSGELLLPQSAALGRRFHQAFEQSTAVGILAISSEQALDENAAPALRFWTAFGREFLTRLCQLPPSEEKVAVSVPGSDWLETTVASAPPAVGMEYLSTTLLADLWRKLDQETTRQVSNTEGGLESWLKQRHSLWRLVGRVTFHLAENPRNEQYPFAFLATYTHRLSAQNQLQYLPLGRALRQYADEKDAHRLQSLLIPVQKAAEANDFARELLESRSVFQALPWTPEDAYRFLESVPDLETAGIITKVPDWWRRGRPSRPQIRVAVDTKKASKVGAGALLVFSVDVALGGESLSSEEWQRLLAASGNLVSLKGQWVEVDREKLKQALEAWQRAEEMATLDGVPFFEGMRLLAGLGRLDLSTGANRATLLEGGGDWTQFTATGELRVILEELRTSRLGESIGFAREELKAELRNYQQAGVGWLTYLAKLGIGACLADDMGLGKTLQVIASLVARQRDQPSLPSLLVVPASLVGNWRAEFEKFAPQLRVRYAHPSQSDVSSFTREEPNNFDCDALLTTYSMLRRLPAISIASWDWLVIDEAQAIKNPTTAQSRSVKAIKARQRIALTGTPIENSVTDLWSLFDFLNPGLLGTASQFKESMTSPVAYHSLRKLVQPYILRRLKSDPTIISDLPDKTEVKTHCALVKSQAAIYEKTVGQLACDLKDPSIPDIQRRGLVIAALIRLKQVCNHPALITGSGNFDPKHSGKFARLQNLAEEIASRGENVLVFSQFREMIGPLSNFLEEIFGRPGLTLHGGTAVKRRQELVDQFQNDRGAPFFVISLKAGGTGLNLTAASHVIHFDRWWNPAVENQATDRAYRIGQRRNVLVHKFLCPGTVEERIDEMITEKQTMANQLIEDVEGTSTQKMLTEMSTDELIDFVSLDVTSAAF